MANGQLQIKFIENGIIYQLLLPYSLTDFNCHPHVVNKIEYIIV